jgi:hypothetical protein
MCRYVKYTNTNSQLMYVAEEHSIYGSSRVGVDNRKDTLYMGAVYTPTWGGVGTSRRALGLKSFELANHLGNVLVTVSDKPVYKVSSGTIFFKPEVSSISDYYPFGAPIHGRSFSSTEYRFGLQSQERDDEINGEGNNINFKYRMHDTRHGRFFARDPLAADYPWNSPYAFSENRIIDGIELEGLEWKAIKDNNGNVTSANYMGNDENGAAPAGTVPSVAFKSKQNGIDVLQVGMPDGTIKNHMANEKGMVQLPKDNNNPNSQFTLTNGNVLYNTYKQSGNDNYGPISGVAGLYNAAVEYQQLYSGERIAIGDMNSPNKLPISIGNGKSHHGITFQVDIRFLSTNGGSQQGDYLSMKFDPLRSKKFFDIMYLNGFSKVLIHNVPAGNITGSKIGIIPDPAHSDHYHFQGFRGN